MTTYDRNRNAITTGSRVMVSGTGHTGKILSIDTEGLTAEQIRRGKTVVVEGCEVNKLLSGKSSPKIALIASNDWTRAFPSALLCTAF